MYILNDSRYKSVFQLVISVLRLESQLTRSDCTVVVFNNNITWVMLELILE